MEKRKCEGWHKLTDGYPWFEGEGSFQLLAYSEFMPPPRVGCSPYGETDANLFTEDDPYGWHVPEIEEIYELKPGLEHIARQIMGRLQKLGSGHPEYHIAGHSGQNLVNNPYWPQELAECAGKLDHERYVSFLPMMLSRTQDDKGRVRWTFFGGSDQGLERTFWKSFYTAPGKEIPEIESQNFILHILNEAYGEKFNDGGKIYASGFRILPSKEEKILPSWTKPYIITDNEPADKIKYLLTFRPFGELPAPVRKQYLIGKLALLPFPGSMVFWGMPTFSNLLGTLPHAVQIPLLRMVARHNGHGGVRVPQSGWFHELHADKKTIEVSLNLLNDSYHRTNRWQRIHKHEDELAHPPRVAKIAQVLFSTELDIMGLYDKPLARNCQLWTKDYTPILDGPRATRDDIIKAEETVVQGGLFGYRFLFPPMRVGVHEIYWQRPVVAFRSAKTGEMEVLTQALTGYFTAYNSESADTTKPVELWPRLLNRNNYISALCDFENKHDHYAHQTTLNILTLFDNWKALGEKPLDRTFARHLVRIAKYKTIEQWLNEIPEHAKDAESGKRMQEELEKILAPAETKSERPIPLTFDKTTSRAFEVAWWNDINFMAHGEFVNKDNADCVQDPITLSQVKHHKRDLERLGDYLLDRHRKAIAQAGMEGKAVCGELPFKWHTDASFNSFGGWKANADGHTYERNLLVVIPGKDRSKAVVMGDHYDTAYMEDVYEKSMGGTGARISAAGADDNYSATATLLLAAPIFLEMSKQGKLEHDIWLLHITGEEFPSDCMGARNFCQSIIEKNLKLHIDKKNCIDLSGTKVIGAFVLDMIGHNRDNAQDIFQVSPGKSRQSLQLAYQAHIANMIWNEGTTEWNAGKERHGLKRGARVPDGSQVPAIAAHLPLMGEVRTQHDPHSSIYNTDGQIFSDIGAPVVLFMENYDLHRTGYHDTKDTMENIDLDYGAAFAAIAIETVARVATMKTA